MKYSLEWGRLSTAEQLAISKFQDKLPVKLSNIANELGLIVKSATLDTGISGEIKREGQNFLIRVNRHDVKERQRFTVAHEIAHFLLHRDLIGDGIVDDLLYRSGLTDTLEAEANRLAADILMPWSKVNEFYHSMPNVKIEERIEKIANAAEVSITAVKIRLGKV
ncbi:ImmA/IrrE family metallo-endopeptidase [uncultured Rheinheimera sp.]|uniref:ImmA/IrrE family metallo-endopeptidase n=1 Tax=uncultured Rheinheimera sp. TaxID=400532 RepID=UPI002595C860|nr:ImmA/IrrE family metallo-endopeptidase [uncultured Rheinheimera sp.]